MARTVLTAQTVTRAGLVPSYGAVDQANGEVFVNTGKEFLLVKNGDGSDHTVTITTPGTIDGQAIPDLAVVVTLGEERCIGPFPKAIYNTTDTGQTPDLENAVLVDYDSGTSVTVALIKVPDSSY